MASTIIGNDERAFLATLYLALTVRYSALGDREASRASGREAFMAAPAWVGRSATTLADLALGQTLADKFAVAEQTLASLPVGVDQAGRLRQQVLGRLHIAQAFGDFSRGCRAQARQHMLSGLAHDLAHIRNRGVLAMLAKTLWTRDQVTCQPVLPAVTLDDHLPVAVASMVKSALKCPIEQVERVAFSKRRIFVLQAGGQTYVLHLLEGGPETLDRRLAIAAHVRAAGVPAPAPIHSSRADTSGTGFHWLLEEWRPGAFFEPARLSVRDQLGIVTALGHCLRQLHSVAVTGFGPLQTTQLTATYATWQAWLAQQQAAIADSCVAGEITAAMLPALAAANDLLAVTAPAMAVLCHGELSSGNILVRGSQLSALIDWEGALGCDPAYDVANLFTTMSHSWYPDHDEARLTAFLAAYQPTDAVEFRARVLAHRLLYVAGAITWLKHYGEDQYRSLVAILNDARVGAALP